jgi:hypothetical protein
MSTNLPTIMTTTKPPTKVKMSLARSRSRSPITILLILLGTLAIIYQLFAHFPTLSDSLASSIAFTQARSCIKDIGDAVCCDLFQSAQPCVEECRKEFVDRETLAVTEGFVACEGRCRAVYRVACGGEEGGKEGEGEEWE